MKPHDKAELDNMALGVELARQLCHDFSNLLYNLLLQLEIWDASPSPPRPADWEHLRRDAKKISGLLQEWDRFHDRFSFADMTLDLHTLIREVAHTMASQSSALRLAPSISAEPLWIKGSPLAVWNLIRLAVEDVLNRYEPALVLIESERQDAMGVMRISARREPNGVQLGHDAPEQPSLASAACRSLSIRLDANIRREPLPDGGCVVHVEFPLSQELAKST